MSEPIRTLIINSIGNTMTDYLIDFVRRDRVDQVYEIYSEFVAGLNSLKPATPFFDKTVLVILYLEKIDKKELKKVLKEIKDINDTCDKIQILVINYTHKNYEVIEQTLDKSYHKYIDLSKPPAWLVDEYLKYNKLTLTPQVRVEFDKRMRYQWRDIDIFTQQLLLYEEVTLKELKSVIGERTYINYWEFVLALLKKENMNKYFNYFKDYRYAHKYVWSECDKVVSSLLNLKGDYIDGLLSYNTIEEYCKKEKMSLKLVKYLLDDALQNIPESEIYKLKLYLDFHKNETDFIINICSNMGGGLTYDQKKFSRYKRRQIKRAKEVREVN